MRRYLSWKDLAKITERGRYAAAPNLYLQVKTSGTRSWLFRYHIHGKARHMGVGPIDLVSLPEARDKTIELRKQVLNGIDPLDAKRQRERERILATARAKTLQEVAIDYIAAHEAGWKGDASRMQWTSSLKRYAFPKIGKLLVNEVDLPAVLSVVEPIWTTKHETARRVRNRIELILGYATAKGLRQGDNPARWNGLLENLLPKINGGRKNLAALPYAQVGAFMRQLRAQQDIAARGLEFAILTATRPNETCGARWSEFEGDTWFIPAERMKGGKPHRVPLSSQARALLDALPRDSEYCFPAPNDNGKPLQTRRMLAVVAKMGHAGKLTSHGLARATFKTWATECTGYAYHVVETALAHAVGTDVERAYQRGDLLDQRARLMRDWANFCDLVQPAAATVTPIRKGA